MTKPTCGNVPSNALVAVQSGTFQGRPYTVFLETATAAAYLAANAALYVPIAPPLGGYRSYADQAALKGSPASQGSTLASTQIQDPGTGEWSHGWGTCVDIALANNGGLVAHGGDFGFVKKSPAGEPNHYEFAAPTWAPLAANQRMVMVDGAQRRAYPSLTAEVLEEKRAGAIVTLDTFTYGDAVGGVAQWVQDVNGGWYSLTVLTDSQWGYGRGPHDLLQVDTPKPPQPVPPPPVILDPPVDTAPVQADPDPTPDAPSTTPETPETPAPGADQEGTGPDPVQAAPVQETDPELESPPSWFKSFLQALIAWLTAWLR